jgi:hypothetical protein
VELGSIGLYGLAEAELLDGPDGGDRGVRPCDGAFADPVHRRSPWYLMALSGYVSAAVRELDVPESELVVWGGACAIAACRQRREGVDRPVLGTALIGWSAWAIRQPELIPRGTGRSRSPRCSAEAEHAEPEPRRAFRGCGADRRIRRGRRGRADAAALDPDERVARGLAVLGAR